MLVWHQELHKRRSLPMTPHPWEVLESEYEICNAILLHGMCVLEMLQASTQAMIRCTALPHVCSFSHCTMSSLVSQSALLAASSDLYSATRMGSETQLTSEQQSVQHSN